jgi:hypothetical protein
VEVDISENNRDVYILTKYILTEFTLEKVPFFGNIFVIGICVRYDFLIP